jgi:hypothetical protein
VTTSAHAAAPGIKSAAYAASAREPPQWRPRRFVWCGACKGSNLLRLQCAGALTSGPLAQHTTRTPCCIRRYIEVTPQHKLASQPLCAAESPPSRTIHADVAAPPRLSRHRMGTHKSSCLSQYPSPLGSSGSPQVHPPSARLSRQSASNHVARWRSRSSFDLLKSRLGDLLRACVRTRRRLRPSGTSPD